MGKIGKDIGELFDIWMDEHPFDGSSPQEQHQSEIEYMEAFIRYVSDREKSAFYAGFTCGRGYELKSKESK